MKSRVDKISSDRMTLYELLLGNLLILLIGAIVLLFFSNRIENEIGYIFGVAVSCGMVIHMHSSVASAVAMKEEKSALNSTRKSYLVRVAGIFIAFAVFCYFEFGNPITAVIGLLALKVSVYLQPFTHKILEKILRKGG